MHPPKTVKDRLKNFSPPTKKKLEEIKQKPQAPIQAGKIQMNTKVNNERSESAFKLSSTKFSYCPLKIKNKSPIRINKQFNAQGSTKPLQKSYNIETMDSDTDRRVASLNLEETINNYNS